ncbi:hypothetical protein FA048_12575 [Pedobacter polaris]|uniref:Uncharacterized protein n=1 Tax=Pedobacter polaris TaxID=2571273 RepID=A0A4U1CMV6_9SPHI|nr:hypothetical protein [Pedobacter polaris]TKC07993.1 hypothetical protein FA048_12575 [Pedobacter polaris]
MGMFGPTFNDHYQEQLEKVREEILRENDAQILGSDVDELSKYYFQRYSLVALDFDPEDIAFEPKKEVRRVRAHQREFGYQSEGDTNWEYEVAIISLPIQPNSNLHLIMKLNGLTRTLDGFDESISFERNEISYKFDTKWYGGSMDEDAMANEINSKSDRLINLLNAKNSNIIQENTNFLGSIKNILSQRKTKLESDNNKINALTQKIRIPLKQKVPREVTKISVDTRDFVKVVKPTPKLPEEYTLEETILSEILNFIDNQCLTFERTPSSYKQLGEEQLRDIILAALNAIFEGNATGETFVKKGKTDIHLKIEKGEILIFECKLWGGEKTYLDTIDQLTRYVTWRQNYGVIIMFCKNRDFSKVLAQVPGIIQSHSNFVGGYKAIGSSHFVTNHTLPEDTEKKIKVHHLLYNLYSE